VCFESGSIAKKSQARFPAAHGPAEKTELRREMKMQNAKAFLDNLYALK